MHKDSRITIGLALLYFLNGFINVLGPAKTFAPLVFIDSFLLALLSLVFVVLPPFKKVHLVFLLFALHFTLLGCFSTNVFQHLPTDIANQVLILVLCTGFYIYLAWPRPVFRWILLVPGLLFLVTILLRYLEMPLPFIVTTAILSGLWQVYILARPDLVEQLGTATKRFCLLMVLMIFFDSLYQAFLHLNFSQQVL